MGSQEWIRVSLFAVGYPGGACPTCGHEQTTGMWLMLGFLGQAVFTARFLAQWIASERKKTSVVPVVFWWLSMLGGLLLLTYAIKRQDPVIIVGQSMGVFIYIRNLMLVAKGKKRAEQRGASQVSQQHRPHLGKSATVNQLSAG